jgi:hypothetical protein
MSDDSSGVAIALTLSPFERVEFAYRERVKSDPHIRQTEMRMDRTVCLTSAGSVAQIFFIKSPFLPSRRVVFLLNYFERRAAVIFAKTIKIRNTQKGLKNDE